MGHRGYFDAVLHYACSALFPSSKYCHHMFPCHCANLTPRALPSPHFIVPRDCIHSTQNPSPLPLLPSLFPLRPPTPTLLHCCILMWNYNFLFTDMHFLSRSRCLCLSHRLSPGPRNASTVTDNAADPVVDENADGKHIHRHPCFNSIHISLLCLLYEISVPICVFHYLYLDPPTVSIDNFIYFRFKCIHICMYVYVYIYIYICALCIFICTYIYIYVTNNLPTLIAHLIVSPFFPRCQCIHSSL